MVGVEQMTTTPPAEIGRNLLKASYVREEADIDGGFAGIFGKIAGLYFQRWGDQSDALARIAAKNHKNGVGNPYAQIRKDLGYEFCRAESDKNPLVAGPLKRTDCSLVSDGAAALVLADVETALKLDKAIVFRAAQHVQDFLPMSRRDILKFEGCSVAWQRALHQAGIGLKDLSFAEVHDCFTIAELIEYEAMGLAPEGQGARVIADGLSPRTARCRSIRPAASKPRVTRSAPPACRCTRSPRCSSPAPPATCRSRTPSSAAFSIWAARRWPITSVFWSGCGKPSRRDAECLQLGIGRRPFHEILRASRRRELELPHRVVFGAFLQIVVWSGPKPGKRRRTLRPRQ